MISYSDIENALIKYWGLNPLNPEDKYQSLRELIGDSEDIIADIVEALNNY
ncbi:hypothetical protein BI049_gp024 [Salmonella phage vB_SnwM_CGG4-1]|uniref:Uncharacterized protein n=1 Tax=Salmonella phage vB_SnwM_CGG4-1 TaxID=1815631 RepID=A0A1B0VV29_9CAUD|nr:hypothetical protein BI049_gp024 [Salmonella phage vB_SnwM_CGG4-1]ANA49378.1 hypothetical protein CGG41_024 [Salmonella phage vB_SnwM_CGG4-1]